MLNVGALHEGFVLDHIKAGKAMTIYHDLKLDKLMFVFSSHCAVFQVPYINFPM